MKKFVSMENINRVFDDLSYIDYITVSDVTDSTVKLKIHLKQFKAVDPKSKEYEIIRERCVVLGKMLERKIQVSFDPVPWYSRLINKILG